MAPDHIVEEGPATVVVGHTIWEEIIIGNGKSIIVTIATINKELNRSSGF